MKHNLKIVGSFFGSDGYTSHTKNLFEALMNQDDINIKIETQLFPGWERLVSDNELNAITKEDNGKFDNIIIAMPHQWKLLTGLNKNYAFVIWEGDKVPKSWIEDFLNPNINYIFVPSKHTKDAILNTLPVTTLDKNGINNDLIINKIRIIPHGVDLTLFHNQRKKDNDDGSNVSLSGDTKITRGKKNKDEQMPVESENHVDCGTGKAQETHQLVENEVIGINTHSGTTPFKSGDKQ